MDLSISLTGQGQARTVRLEGTCDLASAPKLRQVLLELSASGVTNLTLDLSDLDYLDSTGLGVIFGGLRRVREGDGTLRVVGAKGSVLRVLEVTGLDKVLSVSTT